MSEGSHPYEAVLTPAAARGVRKLPRKDLERVLAKVRGLEADPRPRGVEKLTDRGERYRIRSEDYRIIYAIDDEARTVEVETIGHRKDVYRE
jgi:mRNA interferase RelE/StbE